MRMSQLFTKTQINIPKDEVSLNARLLIQAGFIYKEMAGVYAFLPLGLKVLEKIKNIVSEEMNKIGGIEILMTSLQKKELWEKTDRWDDEKVDVWFKSTLKDDKNIGFAWSHEEPITNMMKLFINSYKDLPVYVYQFQNKFRNEARSKSGILRTREFLMKDMYSYSLDSQQHEQFYNKVIETYLNIFERVDLKNDTYLTFASGGAFTEFSHEFQTVADIGEDTIYICDEKRIAINKEVYNDKVLKMLDIKKDKLRKVKAIEVGNIFNFGTIKTKQLNVHFTDSKHKNQYVHLGSYGIGITRLMGTLVEKFHDKDGIIWPESVSPFKFHLINLAKIKHKADNIYNHLSKHNIEVIYDDRENISNGQKLNDCDLIGCTYRIIISDKTLKSNSFEIKQRSNNVISFCDFKNTNYLYKL